METHYGPALPPGFQNKNQSVSSDSSDDDGEIGPSPPTAQHHSSDSEDAPIGPALLRGFKSANEKRDSSEYDAIGPALPPGFKSSSDNAIKIGSSSAGPIGPALPPGFNQSANREQDSGEDDVVIGPAMPPGFKSSGDKPHQIGPALPPGFASSRRSDPESDCGSSDNEYNLTGPALPPGLKKARTVVKGPTLPPGVSHPPRRTSSDSNEDDFIVGPLPAEMSRGTDRSLLVEEFERRAQNMKDKLNKMNDDTPLERESWMMELPPEMGTNFGLSARKFRTNPSTRGGDRSGWTDTPADKAKKEKDAAEGKGKKKAEEKNPVLSVRDRMLAETVDKYNKNKRKETLLDIHQNDRKKKKTEEEDDEPKGRRPFDRDTDLQVNRFDDAQRKSVIKKSQKLNTRFSHGGSQFL